MGLTEGKFDVRLEPVNLVLFIFINIITGGSHEKDCVFVLFGSYGVGLWQ